MSHFIALYELFVLPLNSPTLIMKTAGSAEMSVYFYQTKWRRFPEHLKRYVIAVLLVVVGPAGRPDHDQQHCYHQAPTVNQRLLLQLL